LTEQNVLHERSNVPYGRTFFLKSGTAAKPLSAKACAANIKSIPPIGCPARSSVARRHNAR